VVDPSGGSANLKRGSGDLHWGAVASEVRRRSDSLAEWSVNGAVDPEGRRVLGGSEAERTRDRGCRELAANADLWDDSGESWGWAIAPKFFSLKPKWHRFFRWRTVVVSEASVCKSEVPGLRGKSFDDSCLRTSWSKVWDLQAQLATVFLGRLRTLLCPAYGIHVVARVKEKQTKWTPSESLGPPEGACPQLYGSTRFDTLHAEYFELWSKVSVNYSHAKWRNNLNTV
ncbi:hypothetical protein LEMLEM_LOCUS100, partial [Lemmus lemmus]